MSRGADFPSAPSTSHPHPPARARDPYAAPDARERSIAAARERAAAFAPTLAPPALDATDPAALTAAARVNLMLNEGGAYGEIAGRLGGLFEKEEGAWGRSVLASTAPCLLQSSSPDRARELSLLAVQAEPKNPDGQHCAPWEQLLAVTIGTADAGGALRAMQAWEPWDSNAWSTEAQGTEGERALAYALRTLVDRTIPRMRTLVVTPGAPFPTQGYSRANPMTPYRARRRSSIIYDGVMVQQDAPYRCRERAHGGSDRAYGGRLPHGQ